MKTKIAVNIGADSFRLSEKAISWLRDRGVTDETTLYNWRNGYVPRHHPLLVELVEELGITASGNNNGYDVVIKVVEEELPDNRYVLIVEYYGGPEIVYTPEDDIEEFFIFADDVKWVTVA